MLEVYLKGRINQLVLVATTQPGEKAACDMAVGELQSIVDRVLPHMREVDL